MSKLGAFIILILLIGIIGYIYYQNSNDIGVKIEKLKLKHAISPNSDPENILSFSNELGKIETLDNVQKAQINFEKNYWTAIALNKTVTKYLSSKESIFGVECNNDSEFNEIADTIEDAKAYLESAKTQFDNTKTNYDITRQEEWSSSLLTLEKAITINDNLIFTICPTQ